MSSTPAAPVCRCVAYDRRVEEPRHGATRLCRRWSLKARTSILGALSAGGGDDSALPAPGVFSVVVTCAGYAATRSEDLVDQIYIMVDAIGADGGPADHLSGDGPPVCNEAVHSRRHREIRVEPDNSEDGIKRGHVCAQRHLTCRTLPPEGCGTWATARPPQPQKSGPSCRFAAARSTPVFGGFPYAARAVRAPLIRPPRRCASGG